jgi:hypothetical protein
VTWRPSGLVLTAEPLSPAALAAPTRRPPISPAELVIGVCLAALVIPDLQLGVTLFERWRLAVPADVAVVIVAALTRRHLLVAASAATRRRASSSPSRSPTPHQRGWVFLVGYGSSPGLGEVTVLCLLCAPAARSSDGVSLASGVASPVAAVGAITRYRTDSA